MWENRKPHTSAVGMHIGTSTPRSDLAISGRAEVNRGLWERRGGKTHRGGSHGFPLHCFAGKGGTPFPALSGKLDRSVHCLLVGVTPSPSMLPSESGRSEAVSVPSFCHLVQTFVEMWALVVSLQPLPHCILECAGCGGGHIHKRVPFPSSSPHPASSSFRAPVST